MPFISEAASAIKSRFGFHGHSSSESVLPVRSTPDVLVKSASRDPDHSSLAVSAVRRIGDWNDDATTTTATALPPSQSFEFQEDPAFWKDNNVQVVIRVRPLNSSEISIQGYNKCVRQESCQTITWAGHPESRFTFDLVADENVSQEKLFKVAGVPMVENCVGGYNSCMFAYGQTGSGKTHTMLGDIEGGTRRHSANCGMTPRVFEYLFSRIQKEKEIRKEEKLRFTCKCSFLEIYNEQILDLLDPSSNNLQIREDNKKGVYVENLKEIEVTSARDVMQQLIQGAANRKVAATNMNRASSRSHSVFTCAIESKWESQGVTHHRFARLNLVDLAGSERQKSSGAEGERLKEATNINKSLSTLGLVIMNLVSISNGKSLHVPYRDSKLTFLLQDSLGGNSKTIIIANISPSSCCSLETLSTLKFAQRAKFIKNNAVVNEDASGDVIAMRMQIQQLKKEVSRLRGLVNRGGEALDNDTISFPGSPGSFTWEGLQGSFSPLTSDKRMSQKKDYEVALVGAFKREKEKEIALQALAAENQAAMQLAKQREDEIQGLKMRLRFREAGIKRLEAVASGKISAEAHFLKEKEEYLKEIEVLRAQVDRNQEVTRFAMENLRLKEEIRRLKSSIDEGEHEMMNQQIAVLQNKLLEALDWKLMHEADPLVAQKTNLDVVPGVDSNSDQLLSGQAPDATWCSSLSEENELLRMQAIENQAEIGTLQKKIDFYLEEKETLERHVEDLLEKLGEERSSRAMREQIQQTELHNLSKDMPIVNFNDQTELKTMVDAIAAASQREAEALERVYKLTQENDELRFKLKGYVEDNKQLVELYEQKAAENDTGGSNKAEISLEDDATDLGQLGEEKEAEMKKVIENLEQQLTEMHEENEKLLSLYEKAMQERDEFKRVLSSNGQNIAFVREFDCPEKLVEVDGGEPDELSAYIEAKESEIEAGLVESNMRDVREDSVFDKFTPSTEAISRMDEQTESSPCPVFSQLKEDQFDSLPINEFPESGKSVGYGQSEAGHKIDDGTSWMEIDPSSITTTRIPEYLNWVQTKLESARDKLSGSSKTLDLFGSLEKAFMEVDKLSREMEVMEGVIEEKQQLLESLKVLSSEMRDRKDLSDKKLSALKYSLSSFSSSVAYFEQREARARARLSASLSYLDKKKEELGHLQACKGEIEASMGRMRESETEARNNLAVLKSKLEEENRAKENEKVLFAIDNMEKMDPSQRNWYLGGKATELLKSEEEKNKLQHEMKLLREKLGAMRKEFDDLNKKFVKVEDEMKAVIVEILKGSNSVEEMELALQRVAQEKETLFEVRENGKTEFESMIVEYQQHVFEAELKEAELKTIEDELQLELRRIEQLRTVRAEAAEKVKQLFYAKGDSCFLSEKIETDLESVSATIKEAETLLGMGHSNNS
ncbi:hypothetical protein SLE2022_353660 [Rubroshorea leprosula]